jgi:chromosome partitioning protein
MMLTSSLALVSQKGGVGKTTMALNLGLALAQLGRPTTVLEIDPQGSLGSSLLQPRSQHSGLVQVLAGASTVGQARVETKVDGLSLLPVGEVEPLMSSQFEATLASGGGLGKVVVELHELGAEVVLVDCPSGLGDATKSALAAVSHALLPLLAEPLSLRSVELVLQALEQISEEINPRLTLLGLVLCMLDRSCEASLSVAQAAWQSLPAAALFETVIPRNSAYLEASLHGVPVGYMSKGRHPEGRRFAMLAQEVLDRLHVEEEVIDGGPVETLL